MSASATQGGHDKLLVCRAIFSVRKNLFVTRIEKSYLVYVIGVLLLPVQDKTQAYVM